MVKKDSANVIKMTVQGEQATSCLVGPNFDLIVIATRHKEGLCLVEVHSSNGSIMFFESVDKRAHSVIPELDGRRMKCNEDPWSAKRISPRDRFPGSLTRIPFRVERNAFGP